MHIYSKNQLITLTLLLACATSVKADADSVAAGGGFTCALIHWSDSNSTTTPLQCWGANDEGQLNVPADLQKTIQDQSDLGRVGKIVAGQSHACFHNFNDDAITCWGGGQYSQQMTTVPSNLGPIQSIAAGGSQTCVVHGIISDTEAPSVTCWGVTVGDNLEPPAVSPEGQSPGGSFASFVYSSVGGPHSCGTFDKGTFCWGCSDDEQNSAACSVPQSSSTNRHSVLAVGRQHACGIVNRSTKNDGSPLVDCWGSNEYGQLDIPDVFKNNTNSINGEPVNIGTIMAGDYYTCVVWTTGIINGSNQKWTFQCWGRNQNGVLDVPKELTNPGGIASTGSDHVCAEQEGEQFYDFGVCWGNNANGQVSPAPEFFTNSAGTSRFTVSLALVVSLSALAIIATNL